ncbi:MauE/DoxX family redox-associated membrane protein [Streptomyces sp. NPDC005962]|uniref:MauE/DoxX family redox-associated membrane protein n=1 Tax=Streptomyces sp. NPDC005962 TaxID=3154466 RepID=UPI0033C72CFD
MSTATLGPVALDLAAPLLAGVLGAAGAGKLSGHGTARSAHRTALARLLRGGGRAALALRGLGALELLLCAALLVLAPSVAAGAAVAALGAGFLGYLGYARAAAPGASCGCTARDDGPVGARAFARAAVVAAGGVAVALARHPWWVTASRHPAATGCCALVAVAGFVALSADRRWRTPWRRLRLRLTGNPLTGTGAGARVPVAATVELLEHSLAWQSTSPLVRSALLDHWDDGGWRILQYAGVHAHGDAARPVVVLFALDAAASRDAVREPAVRVSVLDADTGEPVAKGGQAQRPLRS